MNYFERAKFFKTKKRLGQNFLINGEVIQDIIDNANIQPTDVVVEIGPGVGFVTEQLVKYAKKVIAVELDEEAIRELKKLGIADISLCTGDEENVAKEVATKLGIKNYYAGLLPEDKVMVVTDKVQSKQTVAFVGDGINDAPPLANSNVGIAMGCLGSDVAVESADVVVMTDEPSKVAHAIKKAKKTHRIVLENIIGSIAIKVIVMALVGFGFAGMWLAVFADVGVSLLAVLNGLRAMLK